jgi:1-acyl-sn-glycerol-3-phosphate acyltransferase
MDAMLELLRYAKQTAELAAIGGYYHIFKLLNGLIDQKGGVIEQRIAQLLGRSIVEHFGYEAVVEGAEHLRDLHDYAVVSNHASYADWALILGYFPEPVRFIAKKELIWVPVIGDYLRLRGVLIDRKNGIGAREAIEKAAREKSPWPILIFPEGTRSKDGDIHDFRRGGLSIIAKAGLSLLPLALVGTADALPKGVLNVRPGFSPLRVVIGEPVHAADFGHDANAMMDEVERRVRDLYYSRRKSR